MNSDVFFKGKIIPSIINIDKPIGCSNSYCSGDNYVSCFECINFPTGAVAEIKQEYLDELYRDRNISEDIERVSDD